MANTNPLKAITEKCLDCSGNSTSERNKCHIEGCPLHPFRLGNNPFRKKRIYSEEEKAALSERLKKARKSKATQ